ncbi:ribosomal protein S18 acetylase RimI-like enzyme [Agromyces terreus]|uniref:Ribosomal protein S18 acetylase RimI-like enzyme n=1 Tax=Agromyces terreus TaxID=424795 RepID=A0A9X2H715_9MICO|nr:GNAT family N-acetyltransferase [Agromyces terreus]MCP2371927.1 ribosomal protein S18 acetylase RimI-like enzyme [Agromyces terreus]
MTSGHVDAALTFELADPRAPEAQSILERFFTEIVARYRGRPATASEVAQVMLDEPSDDLRGDDGFLLLAREGDRVIGCGGVRVIEPGTGELTRVFVDAMARGRGAGRLLIDELESVSTRRGIRTLRLTVRGDLTEAQRLYRRLGYEAVTPFSRSPYADHQLAKTLVPLPRQPIRSGQHDGKGASPSERRMPR